MIVYLIYLENIRHGLEKFFWKIEFLDFCLDLLCKTA